MKNYRPAYVYADHIAPQRIKGDVKSELTTELIKQSKVTNIKTCTKYIRFT
jgi:hypothetical protein